MPFRIRFALMATLVPLVAGCAELQTIMAHATGDYPGLPKPAPVVQDEPRFDIDLPQPPPPPPPSLALPFPPGRLGLEEAAAALRGDPMALRFLTLKALTEEGLVPLSDAVIRKDANLGALLPLTAGTPPPADAELPIPPIPTVMDRFRALEPGTTERDFLLDQLLAERPAKRVVMAPHDKISGRTVLDRLGRLEDAGLITPDQRSREAAAVETLMATLPEKLLPPEPEEPPEPKKRVVRGTGTGTGGTGSGASSRRLQGGVTGKLEVIPSPGVFEPPKISADFAGQAGVHLLSMATASYGEKAWEALSNQFKQELAGLSYAVQKADLGELGVTYRLIAGPMDPAAAERLCGVIRQKGQACMPTPYPQ